MGPIFPFGISMQIGRSIVKGISITILDCNMFTNQIPLDPDKKAGDP